SAKCLQRFGCGNRLPGSSSTSRTGNCHGGKRLAGTDQRLGPDCGRPTRPSRGGTVGLPKRALKSQGRVKYRRGCLLCLEGRSATTLLNETTCAKNRSSLL